jgi:hypothetical protein
VALLTTLPAKFDDVFLELEQCLTPGYPQAAQCLPALRRHIVATSDPRTLDTHLGSFRRWTRWLHQTDASDSPLSPRNLALYATQMERDGLQGRTIAKYLGYLRDLIRIVDPAATEALQMLAQVCKAKFRGAYAARLATHGTDLLTRDVLEQLAAAAQPQSVLDCRAMAIAWLLYDTMLAPGRVFGEQIGTHYVRPPLYRTQIAPISKGGRFQLKLLATAKDVFAIKPVGAQTMDWIERYHGLLGGPDAFLFCARRGRPVRRATWLDDMRSLLAKASLDHLRIGLESCRRGAALDMLRQGITADDVRRAGGWTSIGPVIRLSDSLVLQPERGSPASGAQIRQRAPFAGLAFQMDAANDAIFN